MNRNSSNLTSAGSEIITNISSQRSLLFSAGKAPKKLITKTYKITNDTSIHDSFNNNINNNISQINNNSQNDSNLKTPIRNLKSKSLINNNKTLGIKEIKEAAPTLDLSNIIYKDGYILKDAANSNPGFGLWSIKMPINEEDKKEQNNKKSEESKNNNIINSINTNNNKYHFNDSDLNYKYTKYIDNEEIFENNIKNKKIIDKLSNRLNDLEKKYMKALSNYQEKKYLAQNAIKMKKEYDKLFNDNINEIKLIKIKSEEMDSNNKILEDALSNTRNEINRLLNIMKEDKENMNKLKEEYENRLKEEEIERAKLNEIIKNNEEKLEILNEENNKLDKNNEKFGLINPFENDFDVNEHKKDYQIKQMKEVVLNLQIKVSELKKEIKKNNEEVGKLNEIMRFKNMKEEYQRININNLFYTIEENEMNAERNNNILKNKNNIINQLNDKIFKQNKIKRNNKIFPKSSSQSLLFNKKLYNI